eukprot:4976354-Amphidinium_carterae.1
MGQPRRAWTQHLCHWQAQRGCTLPGHFANPYKHHWPQALPTFSKVTVIGLGLRSTLLTIRALMVVSEVLHLKRAKKFTLPSVSSVLIPAANSSLHRLEHFRHYQHSHVHPSSGSAQSTYHKKKAAKTF